MGLSNPWTLTSPVESIALHEGVEGTREVIHVRVTVDPHMSDIESRSGRGGSREGRSVCVCESVCVVSQLVL